VSSKDKICGSPLADEWLWVAVRLGDVAFDGDPARVGSYVASFIKSFAIFFGTLIPDDYGKAYLALITCFRLVAVGFFLSIIIKKFSRR